MHDSQNQELVDLWRNCFLQFLACEYNILYHIRKFFADKILVKNPYYPIAEIDTAKNPNYVDFRTTLLIEDLLPYSLLYPYILSQLKQPGSKELVTAASEWMGTPSVDSEISSILSKLVGSFGSLSRKQKDDLEVKLFSSSWEPKTDIKEPAGLKEPYEELSKHVNNSNGIDMGGLAVIFGAWSNLYSNKDHPQPLIIRDIAHKLSMLERRFANSKPTPGMIEHYYTALELVKKYRDRVLPNRELEDLKSLISSPSPSKLLYFLRRLKSADSSFDLEETDRELYRMLLWSTNRETPLADLYLRSVNNKPPNGVVVPNLFTEDISPVISNPGTFQQAFEEYQANIRGLGDRVAKAGGLKDLIDEIGRFRF